MGPRTAEPANTLVLGSGTMPVGDAGRAFEAAGSIDEWNVLLVAYASDPEHLRRKWHDRIAASPANFGTVCIAGTSTGRRAEPVSATGHDVTVTIPSPSNVVELGTTISLYLDDWEAGRTLVCVHSLERLLAHTGSETVFRFLHVLTNRIASTGSVGRFSLDPAAVDERTMRTIEPLFDAVSELESEESESISPDVAFDVLRAARRRYVLYSLRESSPMTIPQLVTRVAYYELDADPDRIEVSLHHSHLPKLEDAGLLSVDDEQISKRLVIESLAPYLDLAASEDRAD